MNNYDNYIKVDEKDDFSIYINNPIWCIKSCEYGHFVNKKTGENIGKYKELYIHYYDENFNLYEEPVIEEDIYEYVNEKI